MCVRLYLLNPLTVETEARNNRSSSVPADRNRPRPSPEKPHLSRLHGPNASPKALRIPKNLTMMFVFLPRVLTDRVKRPENQLNDHWNCRPESAHPHLPAMGVRQSALTGHQSI